MPPGVGEQVAADVAGDRRGRRAEQGIGGDGGIARRARGVAQPVHGRVLGPVLERGVEIHIKHLIHALQAELQVGIEGERQQLDQIARGLVHSQGFGCDAHITQFDDHHALGALGHDQALDVRRQFGAGPSHRSIGRLGRRLRVATRGNRRLQDAELNECVVRARQHRDQLGTRELAARGRQVVADLRHHRHGQLAERAAGLRRKRRHVVQADRVCHARTALAVGVAARVVGHGRRKVGQRPDALEPRLCCARRRQLQRGG